jgi:hypothetical protein
MRLAILLIVTLAIVVPLACSPGSADPEPGSGQAIGFRDQTHATTSVMGPGEPPGDVTWVSPGKVNIGNFYPGARAEYAITVHNGSSSEAGFTVCYRPPDNATIGYVKPAEEVQDWVIVTDETPLLAPGETRDIPVVLEMPKNAVAPGKQWEFWTAVRDTTQSGMVQTELVIRWLVSMR